MSDEVNHPPHYGGDTTYEAVKVIHAWGMGEGFDLGNCIKYICRAGKKPGQEALKDLEKAQWYLNHYIETLKKETEDGTAS